MEYANWRLAVVQGHIEPVQAVDVSGVGSLLVTAGADSHVTLWNNDLS